MRQRAAVISTVAVPGALIAVGTVQDDEPVSPAIGGASIDCATAGDIACWQLTMPDGRSVRTALSDGRTQAPTLLYLPGGPGLSAVETVSEFMAALPSPVRDGFRVVAMDARGMDNPAEVPCAELDPRRLPPLSAHSDWAMRTQSVADIETLVEQCLASDESADALEQYSSEQIVRDLEQVRRWLGVETWSIYGTSYGSEVAQRYALSHPQRVAHLVLDSPFDPWLDPMLRRAESARAASAVLDHAFAECEVDTRCRADMGGNGARDVFDRLQARLSAEPVPVELSSLESPVEITAADLEHAASAFLGGSGERVVLLRTLAAAERDDLRPLARLMAAVRGTGDAGAREHSAYYAYECADYPVDGDDPAAAYMAAADRHGLSTLGLTAPFYRDLPCALWPRPAQASPEWVSTRPSLPQMPVLVTHFTHDHALLTDRAAQIADHWDAPLVSVEGVSHGVLGQSDCADDLMAVFLMGRLSEVSTTSCAHEAPSIAYAPIPHRSLGEYADILDAAYAVETDLRASPEFYGWDDNVELAIACSTGGVALAARADDGGLIFELDSCAAISGWNLTGTATAEPGGRFIMSARFVGGGFEYVRDGEGARLTGVVDGEHLTLHR
jgi:pimeloyl-ACP methyl ester carboxylesterase